MKFTLKTLALCVCAAFTSVSCIQEEAPNAECDILTCEFPNAETESNPVIDNYSVTVRMSPTQDISALAPVFTITDGATITPASGSVQNFLNAENHTIYYTVTSEDGEWSKKYPVKIIQKEIPSEYKFNNCILDPTGKYFTFFENDSEDEPIMTWATGNPGFVMTGQGKTPSDFPTAPVFADNSEMSRQAEYIRLVTRSTGFFGSLVKMRIAAGNIFQGEFDLGIATSNPRGATKFGEPYRYKPTKLKGSFRFKAGETYTDENGKEIAGKKDLFSIYALFFETDEKVSYIDGTIHDSNFTHPNLVSLALMENPHEAADWEAFEIPFNMVDGKTIDPEKLAQGKYKIGIVISSSADGDYFKGAAGSTLDIKDLKIEHE